MGAPRKNTAQLILRVPAEAVTQAKKLAETLGFSSENKLSASLFLAALEILAANELCPPMPYELRRLRKTLHSFSPQQTGRDSYVDEPPEGFRAEEPTLSENREETLTASKLLDLLMAEMEKNGKLQEALLRYLEEKNA
jgi:hypothetical protein